MAYKLSFALILYIVSAAIDIYLGITTLNPYRAYFLRIAAIATITALFIVFLRKAQTAKIFPLFVASLILSIAALTIEGYNNLVPVNAIIKAAAILLTVKPDLIEIEIITEDEEPQTQDEQQKQEKHKT